MGMQLTIQSDEAYRLATRLSELTGESMTAAGVGAFRASVAAAERKRDKVPRVARIQSIAAEIRAELMVDGKLPDLSADVLYDGETGLPV